MEIFFAVVPSDTYLSFFLSNPLWDLWHLFLLGLARIVPIVAICPFLGAKVLSDPMKLGFGVALSALFLPFLIISKSSTTMTFDMTFMALVVKEVGVGAVLGFLISFPFFFAQGAGNLIDHQRGSQSLQVTDPTTQTQSTPIGLLYGNMMLVAFFYVGGPLLFFDAIFTSYKVIPADQFFNASFFTKEIPLWHVVIKLMTTMITLSVQLAAPSLIALLMSDLFLGIANRMAPQVQISFLLWSLKAYVGIGMLWLGWWLVLKQLNIEGLNWIKMVSKLVESLVPK